jgi:hypothetical protein
MLVCNRNAYRNYDNYRNYGKLRLVILENFPQLIFSWAR